jgi:hypothetical protein
MSRSRGPGGYKRKGPMRGSAEMAKNFATNRSKERNAARVRKVFASGKLNHATTLFFFDEPFTKMEMTLNLFPTPVCYGTVEIGVLSISERLDVLPSVCASLLH